MNEELQSTNEELQTINDELRQRSESLNELSTFLESMFTSLRSGVAVLDRDLRVLVWNRQAEELWGVRSAEVEHMNFFSLDIGLPLEQTAQAIRASLAGTLPTFEALLPAVNRRGRAILCRTTIYPLVARGNDKPRGVIVLMDEQVPPASEENGAESAEGADGTPRTATKTDATP